VDHRLRVAGRHVEKKDVTHVDAILRRLIIDHLNVKTGSAAQAIFASRVTKRKAFV
jgi:hypothetical protein